MLIACMAGPLNTGQDIATYLLLHLIPIVLHHLVHLVLPKDPMSFRILAKTIAKTSTWQLRGHPRNASPKRFKCFKKQKKTMVSEEIQDKTIKKKLPSYLVPALFAAFKVVVASRMNSNGSWHSKVLYLPIPRSDLTRTCSPLGSTTMHHDAWPSPPTSLKIATSSTMRGR